MLLFLKMKIYFNGGESENSSLATQERKTTN